MRIHNTILLLLFGLFSISLFGQHIKTKTINGRVSDKYTFYGIEDVAILLKDSTLVSKTDSLGYYTLNLPKKEKRLFFTNKDYHTLKIRTGYSSKKINVRLKPLKRPPNSYGDLSGKNMLGWLPLKHILGALGLKYERFIKKKYSVGAYVDWYYKGRQFFGSEEYTGFKCTPTFRYFFIHHWAMGFYVQASAIVGYFDFSKLNYEYDTQRSTTDEISITYNFWSGGAHVGIGGYFAHKEGKNACLDVSIGIQIFTEQYPSEKEANNKTYTHNSGWWYLGGPGSIFEFKLSLCGIF